MAAEEIPLRLTADEIATIQNSMSAMRQGLVTISETIPGENFRAGLMAKEVKRIQDKIVEQAYPDAAEHDVDSAALNVVAASLSQAGYEEKCICQHGYKSTGSGRQEVMIKAPRCPVHGKPRPNHLRAV